MRKNVVFIFSVLLLFIFNSIIFGHIIKQEKQPKALIIGEIKVLPGEKISGFLEISGGNFPNTKIPITIVNGKQEGPTLALIAGIHGYEYPPILALQQLKKDMSSRKLKGKVIMVHIANLQSFQKRTIYYNPYDWLNLNRVFPGKPDGTISERVAYTLTTEVIDKCDYLVDLHCGDGNEALVPYIYWMPYGRTNVDKISKDMALYFGIPLIIYDRNRPRDPQASIYMGTTAILRGKPAITIESGQLGNTDEESIARIIRGVKNLMKYFKMKPGEPEKFVEPIWVHKYVIIRSDYDGIFYPTVKVASQVKKGDLLGYVTNYFGETIQSAHAPFNGLILYIINTPPINKGEPLVEIGELQDLNQNP